MTQDRLRRMMAYGVEHGFVSREAAEAFLNPRWGRAPAPVERAALRGLPQMPEEIFGVEAIPLADRIFAAGGPGKYQGRAAGGVSSGLDRFGGGRMQALAHRDEDGLFGARVLDASNAGAGFERGGPSLGMRGGGAPSTSVGAPTGATPLSAQSQTSLAPGREKSNPSSLTWGEAFKKTVGLTVDRTAEALVQSNPITGPLTGPALQQRQFRQRAMMRAADEAIGRSLQDERMTPAAREVLTSFRTGEGPRHVQYDMGSAGMAELLNSDPNGYFGRQISGIIKYNLRERNRSYLRNGDKVVKYIGEKFSPIDGEIGLRDGVQLGDVVGTMHGGWEMEVKNNRIYFTTTNITSLSSFGAANWLGVVGLGDLIDDPKSGPFSPVRQTFTFDIPVPDDLLPPEERHRRKAQ